MKWGLRDAGVAAWRRMVGGVWGGGKGGRKEGRFSFLKKRNKKLLLFLVGA
jgi:hypothetical protein